MKKGNLFILLTITFTMILISSLTDAKPQIVQIAKPYQPCSPNYTDITSSVMQRMLQAQYNSGNIFLVPNKLNNRFFSINLYPNFGPLLYHYLYDVGIDGLWNTTDDRAYYISSDVYNEMISLNNNGDYEYFWATYPNRITQSMDVFSCDLTSGCINPNFITRIFQPDEVLGIIPSSSQGKLYIAMGNLMSNPQGTIYSCSLQNNASDSCSSLNPSLFNNLTNFDILMSSFNDEGFFIKKDALQSNQIDFFNINTLSSFSLPLGLEPNSINSAHIPGLIFTFNPTYQNSQQLNLIFINLFSGNIGTMYNLPQGITPIITEFLSSGINSVYSKSSPYRQFVKTLNNNEVEIYRSNNQLNNPRPLTLQNDLRIVSTVSNSNTNGTRILLSNCHG